MPAVTTSPPLQASKQRNVAQTAVLVAGFALLTCISIASIFLVNRTRAEALEMQNAVRVENLVLQAGTYLRRAESAQRGYLLSENESYLDLFQSGLDTSERGAGDLSVDDFDDDQDKRDFVRLRELAALKIKELRETVDLQKRGARDEALALVKTNVGETVMREVARLVESIRDRSRARTQQRAIDSRRSTWALLFVNLASTVAIFVLGYVATRQSRRAASTIESARLALAEANASLAEVNTSLEAANASLEDANTSLEKRVAERTVDLQDANNEIQSFAYIVSHDLRSPLVNIMGFTSELESLRDDVFGRLDAAAGPEDDARKMLRTDFAEAFGFIKTSTGKMDRLINAILKLARSGRRKLNPAPIDTKALAENIAQTMAHQLLDRKATIEVGELPVIENDQLALEQIFTNVLDNAVKYLRDDEPGRILVRAEESPLFVRFEIEDNGRGIDERDKARVWELFRRSGKQDRPGEGIGLAHVRSTVRRLGGTIVLDSEFGRGTVVKLTLPRRLVVEDEPA